MAQPPYQPPHRRVAHGLARHTLQVASPFRGTRRRALGEVLRKQPPYGVVALRRSARRLPRSQRDPIALHPGEALHRGEAHPEEVGGLALGHGALLEGIDYLASEIFGVGFHVCMISCGSRFLLTAVGVLGIVAMGRRDGFREATVIAVTVFSLGATIVHAIDIIETGNLVPGNTLQNVSNLLRPVLLIGFL